MNLIILHGFKQLYVSNSSRMLKFETIEIPVEQNNVIN